MFFNSVNTAPPCPLSIKTSFIQRVLFLLRNKSSYFRHFIFLAQRSARSSVKYNFSLNTYLRLSILHKQSTQIFATVMCCFVLVQSTYIAYIMYFCKFKWRIVVVKQSKPQFKCFLIYKMNYRGLFFYKSYLKFEFLNRNK